MDPLLEQFLSEAQDNLAYLDANLKDLEGGDEEQINALFRAAHTLKGGAGLVGFDAVKNITHAAEDLLDAFRNHKIEYSEALLDALYDAFDEVVELVDACETEGSIEDLVIDEEKIEQIKSHIRSFLEQDSPAESEPTNVENSLPTAPFEVVNAIPLVHLNLNQLERILDTLNRQQTAWVLNLDLDTDTLTLGNDPFYFIELLGEENVIAVETLVHHCEQLQQDPTQWLTQLKIVTTAETDVIEDAFYNVLYEIEGAPLSAECLLPDTAFTEAAQPYLEEVLAAKSEKKLLKTLNKLKAVDPQSLLYYYLLRVGQLYLLNQTEWLNQLLPQTETSTAAKENAENLQKMPESPVLQVEEASKNDKMPLELTPEETKVAIELLETQKKVLNSPNGVATVNLILTQLNRFVSQPPQLPTNTSEEAMQAIEQLIQSLSGEQLAEKTTVASETTPSNSPVKTQSGETTSTTASKTNEQKKTATPKKETAKMHAAMPKTIKVDPEEIDFIMDTVGELLVLKNALPFIAEKLDNETQSNIKRDLTNKYEQISRLVQQLQDRVMGMRLLPLDYIFSRYPKMIRDLSKTLHKKIEYNEYGGDTKLDKMMIEKLADPMIHIIRNSLDHGIEPPEERLAAGKPEVGHLTVGAKSEGDRVVIEITDDGRGIDEQKVINKALEKGLVTPEEIEAMSESERLALIFMPGLSTKEEISDLSGRGVGADAVKTTVESLGGQVMIKSQAGKGTTILLDLPVSAALTNVFQVEMGGNNYAINMEQIVETEKVSKQEVKTANHQPIIQLRGEVIPLILNPQLLNRTEFKEEENLLILHTPIGKVAFVVDAFVDQLDVVQKPLEGPLKHHPFISGVALLGDGSPLFVLSIKHLFGD